ncbi:sulfotransferase 1E1-like [Mercenaria mercenaria]|uniref:sulfotransferase 1E1-like n=1 Tax=Mercenaria mercenaria TaxID=6596 RepID=UPI00234F9E71|nr:sulfotransferase 1E1-like [Mercenaria mercenaria]XP_045196254.2 sulfotransferase 1E1-like [Mercenaria mercenaria]XP_045196256.2 sulfotransferase 1E1-like [Mercenaria mercenaria]XP_045196257.2 sulfotransferase 1E1-like [Mercenaria mercenaria]XP_053396869.1 sulfotransferase 1E1-like [Mercenaria mercenaria]
MAFRLYGHMRQWSLQNQCVLARHFSKQNHLFNKLGKQFQTLHKPFRTKLDCSLYNRRWTTTNTSSQQPTVRTQALLYATYGSFALGGFLLIAILLRELKKKRLQWRGIFEMKVPGMKRLGMYKYKDVTLPEFVVNELENIEKFETTADDIWVVSFPRSGTTWLQEIIYLIQTNVNTQRAQSKFLDTRFPYLEFMTPGIKEIEKMPSPRLLKSHLPYSLLPRSVQDNKPKIIYIARNPKDVVVSYYYFVRLLYPVTRYDGEFKDFFNLFLHDKVMYAPWWRHVEEFWDRRHDDNILFLTYEDLKKDTDGTIDKVAKFLGKTLTREQKDIIINHCSFENMKKNPATNHFWFETYGVADPKKGDFMRKGCVGDWANHFTEEMNQQINQMVGYKFRNSDISFAYRGTHFESDNSETIEQIAK